MRQGLGAACWSTWPAVGRAATRIEGDVLLVFFAGPAQSTFGRSSAAGWSNGLTTGRAVIDVEIDVPHGVVAGPARSPC
jgi:hypothetical protein